MARHGENIHKRQDGRWEGRYMKGKDTKGKTVWGYVYAKTYSEVKKKLIQKKSEVSFYCLNADDPTFMELSENWLGTIQNGVKESTLAHYRYTLTRYILPVLGFEKIKRLTEYRIEQAFLQIVTPNDQKHKPLGHSLAKECLTMIRRICKYACHLRLIRPLEIEVCLPKPIETKTIPLSVEEQNLLKKYVMSNVTSRKIGLVLTMQMGLRIGEVCGLQWGDIDVQNGILTVNRTVQRISCGEGYSKVVIQTPKTKSSARMIPIPDWLIPTLKKLKAGKEDDVWFLSGRRDKPVEPRCYRKSIHVYLKAAKVRQIHPHALRHTFATTCLQAGCDVKTLSQLLGHSDASITLKRYVHTDFDRMRREIARIYDGRSHTTLGGHKTVCSFGN